MSDFWYGLLLFLGLMAFGVYIQALGQRALSKQIESWFNAITKQLDGRLSELLEATKALAHARGVEEGKAKEKAKEDGK